MSYRQKRPREEQQEHQQGTPKKAKVTTAVIDLIDPAVDNAVDHDEHKEAFNNLALMDQDFKKQQALRIVEEESYVMCVVLQETGQDDSIRYCGRLPAYFVIYAASIREAIETLQGHYFLQIVIKRRISGLLFMQISRESIEMEELRIGYQRLHLMPNPMSSGHENTIEAVLGQKDEVSGKPTPIIDMILFAVYGLYPDLVHIIADYANFLLPHEACMSYEDAQHIAFEGSNLFGKLRTNQLSEEDILFVNALQRGAITNTPEVKTPRYMLMLEDTKKRSQQSWQDWCLERSHLFVRYAVFDNISTSTLLSVLATHPDEGWFNTIVEACDRQCRRSSMS